MSTAGMNKHPEDLPQVDPLAYARTEQHQKGEGYGAKHKIPTISGFLEQQRQMTDDHSAEGERLRQAQEKHKAEQAQRQTQKDGAAGQQGTEGKSAGQLEKEEAMNKAKANRQPNAKSFERKGEREVFDPVTGRNVIVRDAKLEDFQNPKLFNEENLDPANMQAPGPSTNISKGLGGDQLAPIEHTTPNPIEPTNISLRPFPPSVDQNSLKAIVRTVNGYAMVVVGGLGVVWFFTAWRGGWVSFIFFSQLIGALAFGIFVAHHLAVRKIEKELDRIRLQMHQDRGEQFSPPTPESVEWLNAFTKVVWPLINPEMFTSLVDMIEDVMQASLPGFVDAVKVEDFTIGRNSFRILNMRALPDQPGDKEYPREEWIDQGSREDALDPNRRIKKREEKAKKEEDVLSKEGTSPEDEDQTGDYVNYEISFAYFAPPGTKKLAGQNISLIIKFFLGMHDLFHLPLPIWIAVESIVGTVRLRCQMVPQVPFIRNVTFTLMGVPAIEASAIPLSSALPNVLDLPLISGFVKSSIAAATSVYCAPKSMTLNIAQMLSGDGIKRDTTGLGVFMVTIHHAENLSAQDDNGLSDPYCVVAYSKFGKPLFSTRIIQKDLNPVWEQTAFILVSADEVRAGEKLSIQLWDSDMISADDLVGRIEVPITDLMLKPNEMMHRTDKLMGFENADSMKGTLTWSVAYYEKAKLNPELKKEPGVDHSLPVELQNHPELKVEGNAQDTPEEADVQRTPPDPQYPAGILSVMIHQIHNLEKQSVKGATGKDRQEGAAGQDTSEASEQADNLPSSYVELALNDDIVYKTRVKQYSSMPFFNCEHEAFIRDYTKTSLRIIVRDARLREHDPILGIVDLPLAETLAHSSEVTRLFAIRDGVGWGKVSVSILFKGLKVELPRELSGWETASICITKPVKIEPVPGASFDFREKKLMLKTTEATQKLPAKAATTLSDGSLEWDVEREIRLPTTDRYSSALYFDFGGDTVTIGPLGKKIEAYAMLWLSELQDDVEKEVRIPIIVASSPSLRNNYLNDQTKKTHEYEIVGHLTTSVMLDSGLDADHEQYAETQTARHEYEQWDRVAGQAQQAIINSHANDDGVIDKREQRAIDEAHRKALESRHRGKMQFRAVRTYTWAKDGAKDRLKGVKDKLTGHSHKEETVATEG